MRTFAIAATVVAAVASVAFLLYAGRNNKSILLAIGFSMWVVSPYVLLVAGHFASMRWTHAPQILITIVMLALSLVSLAVYVADFFRLSKPKGAFVFVLVPPLCWIAIALAAGVLALQARWRRLHQDDGMTM